MKDEHEQALHWTCDQCKLELAYRKVKVRYLGGNFEVELMQCPQCHRTLIGEDLALGKMLEVEQALEDK
jgi:predicted RNA-binding Zn-ribbon protein involved in translation (DUF1610 family)